MLRRIVPLVWALALLIVALPARAAEPVSELPELRPTLSGRFEFALALNKQVFSYGKGEFSGDRVHAVSVDAIENTLVEIVTIDDQTYLREGVQTRWVRVPSEDPGVVPVSGPATPALPSSEPVVYRVGEAEVAGASTIQYQIPFSTGDIPTEGVEGTIKSMKLDLFVGTADQYLHKLQLTILASDPQLGDITLETVIRFYDFNQPIAIGAPPADLVDELPAAAARRITPPGARLLPAWAEPLFGQRLRELRQAR